MLFQNKYGKLIFEGCVQRLLTPPLNNYGHTTCMNFQQLTVLKLSPKKSCWLRLLRFFTQTRLTWLVNVNSFIPPQYDYCQTVMPTNTRPNQRRYDTYVPHQHAHQRMGIEALVFPLIPDEARQGQKVINCRARLAVLWCLRLYMDQRHQRTTMDVLCN